MAAIVGASSAVAYVVSYNFDFGYSLLDLASRSRARAQGLKSPVPRRIRQMSLPRLSWQVLAAGSLLT